MSAFGHNIYIFKVPQGQYASRRGIPDLCCCINGRFVSIEVKTDVGTLTALQSNEIKNIKTAGGIAFTIFGKDDALLNEFIRSMNEHSTEAS